MFIQLVIFKKVTTCFNFKDMLSAVRPFGFSISTTSNVSTDDSLISSYPFPILFRHTVSLENYYHYLLHGKLRKGILPKITNSNVN